MQSPLNANFCGNLYADAEFKTIPGDKQTRVCNFRVAVNNDKDNTESVSVAVFGRTAENMEKMGALTKGVPVFVVGTLKTRTYPKKDGSGQGYSLEVKADYISLLASKKDAGPSRTDDQPPF